MEGIDQLTHSAISALKQVDQERSTVIYQLEVENGKHHVSRRNFTECTPNVTLKLHMHIVQYLGGMWGK